MARTLLVADPNTVASNSLESLLRSTSFTHAGSVAHGKALVDSVRRLKPWAIALDLSLPDHPDSPGVGWVAATAHLRQIAPDLRIIVTCSPENRNLVPAAFAAGARAYIEKPYARGEVLHALNHLAADAPPMNFYVRARRLSQRLSARYAPLAFQGATREKCAASVANVSETGVCLESNSEIPLRSIITLEIDLPDRGEIRGRAQILRSTRGGVGPAEHGIAFVELENAARERLRSFIARTLASEPNSPVDS